MAVKPAQRDGDDMKIKYKTKFNGYLPLLRAALYLMTSNTLSFAQFGAYIVLVSQADFDKRHKNYGVIIRDDYEIADALGCDSTTVYNHRKTLIKKGLLQETNGLTSVPNFYLFEHEWVKLLSKLPPEFFQELFVKPQGGVEQLQRVIEKTQSRQPQKQPQSFNVSSKGELSSSQKEQDDLETYFQENSLEENGKTYER